MSNLGVHPVDVDGPATAHPRPFRCRIDVAPSQESAEVSHINNIEFMRWIDRGAELHCDACGWMRQQLLDAGVMWFVARHEVDYLAEASAADDLLLTTWVEDVRRVKSWRSTVIHRLGPGEPVPVCQARTLWVLVDLSTRRPCRVPLEMARAFDPLERPRLAKDTLA